MKLIGFILRFVLSPLIFVIAGISGVWCFVLRRDEMDDGRQTTHDIAQVAPEEENDDRKRSYGRDQWAKDRSPLGRNDAVYVAFLEDGARVPPNPVPLKDWYAERKKRRAALNLR